MISADVPVAPPPPQLPMPSTVSSQSRVVAESALFFLHMEMASSLSSDQLKAVGMSTGARIIQRLATSRGLIIHELPAMKFLCKEVWTQLFKKSVSRLQTDSRGFYVIHDNSFRWLEHLSPVKGGGEKLEVEIYDVAMLHLAMPCGIIRGALLAFGIDCSVQAEISVATLPACTFTVSMREASSGDTVAAPQNTAKSKT
eukprot:TRINITY_DN21021_c0_g1_i1.p1 TRINITY_DN21021_c0_g1~~TRINITY_DN21021_c0_g1_i1.p1  ORF type:complete len:199 (-),score=40.67 TRINITY_DN21021_c0_g1_i1:45-641(-)